MKIQINDEQINKRLDVLLSEITDYSRSKITYRRNHRHILHLVKNKLTHFKSKKERGLPFLLFFPPHKNQPHFIHFNYS